jgi:hypothetical protein
MRRSCPGPGHPTRGINTSGNARCPGEVFWVQRPVSQAGRILYLHSVRLMVPHPGRYPVEFNPLALAPKYSTSSSLVLEVSPRPSPTSMDSSGELKSRGLGQFPGHPRRVRFRLRPTTLTFGS